MSQLAPVDQSGTSALAARVSAAVSYMRLLIALVTLAPTPTEAATRARVLLPALVSAIGTQTRVLYGEDANSAATTAASVSASEDATGGSSSGTTVRMGRHSGQGVKVRSAASDSAVLCMQTLRYLLAWSEQSSTFSSEGVKRAGSKGSSSAVGGGGGLKADRFGSARGSSGTISPSAGTGKAGTSSSRDKQTKGTRRHSGPSGAADAGKGALARAVAERNVATRKAVERVCQEVIAFSPIPITVTAEVPGQQRAGEGVADMQVDDAANLSSSSPMPAAQMEPKQTGTRTAPPSPRGGGSSGLCGDDMQAVLCSLLQMALEVAGSSPPPSSPSRVASSSQSTCTTSSASASASASNAGASTDLGSGSSPPPRRPMLLVARRWGAEEDGEDADPTEVVSAIPRGAGRVRGASGALSRGVDSNAAAAAAVVAAATSVSGTGTSASSSAGVAAAAAVAAGPSSPELLQALMSELLGQVVDIEQGLGGRGGPSTRGPGRARGAKDKHGGAGATDKAQGKKPPVPKASRAVGGGDEKGGSSKRKPRNSGGGAAGAAASGAASVASSRGNNGGGASKVGSDATAATAVMKTTAEGLMKLNIALRTPALAVLASALQLATVSVFLGISSALVKLFCSPVHATVWLIFPGFFPCGNYVS